MNFQKNFESFIGANNYPIAYLNMPKSACTTIKNILYYLSHEKWHDSPLAIHKNIQSKSVIPRGETLKLNREQVIINGGCWLNFTFVRNPGLRAYSAFIEKIWEAGQYSFPGIRNYLIERGDLVEKNSTIPEPILKNELNICFKNFLRFVDKNIKGETPFPSNPHWCVQSKRIQNYQGAQAISFVGKIERFATDMRYVLNFAGCGQSELADMRFNEGPRPPFRLDEILDNEICNLLNEIYEEDYTTFGYLPPSLPEKSLNKINEIKEKVIYVCRRDRLGMRLVNILQACRFARRAGYKAVVTWPSAEWNLEKDHNRNESQYSLDRFFDVEELNKIFGIKNIIFTEKSPPTGLLSVKENPRLQGQFPKAFEISQINSLPDNLLVDGFAAGLSFKDENEDTIRAGCKELFDLLTWNESIVKAFNDSFLKIQNTPFIAIHIRRGDFKHVIRVNIQNALSNNQPDLGPDLARMLRMLKKKTASLPTLAKTLQSINSPIERILIFSDSPEVAHSFVSFIHTKNTIDVVADWDMPTIDSNQRAAVELLLMSKASYIIGTQSAFTRCAALVGEGKFINAASSAPNADDPLSVLHECAGDLLQKNQRLSNCCTTYLQSIYSNNTLKSHARPLENPNNQDSEIILKTGIVPINKNNFDIDLLLGCMHENSFHGIDRIRIARIISENLANDCSSLDKEIKEICDYLGRKTGKMLHIIQGLLLKGFNSEAGRLAQSYKNTRPYEVVADICMGLVHEDSKQFDAATIFYKSAMNSAPYIKDPVIGLRRIAEINDKKDEFDYYNNLLFEIKVGHRVSKQNLEVFKVFENPHPFIRLGPESDGGYVLSDLPESYDFFCSGGISDNCDFENNFCQHYNVNCDSFDPTINKLPINAHPRIRWHKKAIGYHDNDYCTSLSDILANYKNVFMKLDIESSEYAWLNKTSEYEINNIKQLTIELHNPLHLVKIKLLEKISKTHALIHVHPNNSSPVVVVDGVKFPRLIECTYIRKDFMLGNSKYNSVPFPKVYDFRNIKFREEIFLDNWPFVIS
jgi:hypothetical protein